MSALGARVAAADDVDVNDAPVAFVAACVYVAVAAASVDVVVDAGAAACVYAYLFSIQRAVRHRHR
jgi:hypothetical protein